MGIEHLLKRVILIKKSIKSIYRKLVPNKDLPTFWINKYVKNIDSSIVQIGSNDGNTGDPISQLIRKNKGWKALFVEPVPYLFEKLKLNYNQESRFIFKNVAINDGTTQVFFSVREEANQQLENLPDWYDQLGSFDRKNIIKHLNGVLEPYIIETVVKGMSLSHLLEIDKIDKIDLLHIDTEGYDYKILSQLDLKKYCPTIIMFEHKHLQDLEKKQAVIFLKENYHIFEFSGDLLCLRKDKLSKNDFFLLKQRLIRE